MVCYACVSPAHSNGTRVPGTFNVSVAEDVQEMSGRQHDGIGEPIPNSFLELNRYTISQACDSSFVVGPTGRFQRLGIIGQRADRTSDRRRRCVLSRAEAGLGQSPCTLFGAVCVPRVCRRARAGFGAGSNSVLRHWPSTLPAGIPPTRTRSPPAEGAQRKFGVTAPSNRRHELFGFER